MNSGSGGEGTARRGHNDTGAELWGAKDSLKRHVGGRKNIRSQSLDEVTPLLAGGNDTPTNNGDGDTPQWEGYADYEGLPWWRKPSMYWLLPPFFLFALAVGGIMVPKLNLILQLVCREYYIEKSTLDPSYILSPVVLGSDNPQCRKPEVQALATKFTLYMTIITGSLSAIMSPRLGAWSDRYGRLKLLSITSGGAFLGEIILIMAAKYPETVSYRWILAGSVFDGIFGSFTAGMALTHAYAADCTPPPKRAVAFGYFHACLFSGIAVGPLIAALMVRSTGSIITPFYFALAIHTFFICFVLLVVPESLTKKRQHLAQERYAADKSGIAASVHTTPVHNFSLDGQFTLFSFARKANIFEPLAILFPTGPGTSNALRANLILLSAVDTIIFGVAMGAMTVVVYYLGLQFDWGTPEISVFTSIVNCFRVFALIVILPLLNYVVRTRRANRQRRESGFAAPVPNSGSDTLDLTIIRGAVFMEVLGCAGYAAARVPGMFVLGGLVASLGGIGSPTLQSALTKHVPHDRVGQLLGATGLLHALARVVCPLIFNLIYAGTVGTFPQAVFVVLTGCFVVAFVCSWFIRPNVYLEDPITVNTQHARTDVNPDILVDEEIVAI